MKKYVWQGFLFVFFPLLFKWDPTKTKWQNRNPIDCTQLAYNNVDEKAMQEFENISKNYYIEEHF